MRALTMFSRNLCGTLIAVCMVLGLAACSATSASQSAAPTATHDTSNYIVSPLDEPDTTDFQCTTIHYTVALNVFDRLVEQTVGRMGTASIQPSLAESWEISDDGCTYTFHLRKDVKFSNGSPLTAEDVHYTFVRALIHPGANNQDFTREIVGVSELEAGKADDLAGFTVLDDYTFEIKLARPFSAFLACLSMPGASILDEKSTEEAGNRFGKDPSATVGTGPFVFSEWRAGDRMLLAANPDCWAGAPRCEGIDLRFVYDPQTIDEMYRNGELDIVNIDDLGDLGEYYLNGDAYAEYVKTAPHVGIDYIALNESVAPLNDVRVRKALQYALNRQALLDACLGGSGAVENGIFPRGLVGYNPDLETIPYGPDEAKRLLEEAGYADGFDLQICMRTSSTQWQRMLMETAASMWEKIGVHASIVILDEAEFMNKRMAGQIPCYTAAWAADFDDPDNFVYTFFGSRENTTNRSLCYDNQSAMDRVAAARYITDESARLREYNDLERLIVQEDAAWVPLFSRERHFLVSSRLEDFTTAWNGWFETYFKYMKVRA